MTLLIIGAIIANHLSELRGGQFVRVAILSVAVRIVVMPVLFLILAKYLPCSLELKRVIIIQGAPKKKRKMSAAGRAKISAAAKARWTKVNAAGKTKL